jgi:3-deoxy-D-arabino-heptulosonate 7-phosphate (DAHP) synthase
MHEAASRRLEEMKLSKQTTVDISKAANRKKKVRRDRVEVTMEEDIAENNKQLVAEEN